MTDPSTLIRTLSSASADSVAQLTLMLKDDFSNTVSSATVSISANPPGASIPASVFTDANGVAIIKVSDFDGGQFAIIATYGTLSLSAEVDFVVMQTQKLTISSGATRNNSIIDGTIAVLSGGAANNSEVRNGGLQNVYGSASGTDIFSGGLQVVSGGV